MAINKYNLVEELAKADEKLTGDVSLIGSSGMTMVKNNSGMRTNMFNSHLNQFLTLLQPDFPGVFTNMENLVGRESSGYKKAKKDLIVIRKVVKYADIIDKPNVYNLFVYDEKKNCYDVITRKDCEDLPEIYGYQIDNDIIDTYDEGDTISKDTVLYKSTSYTDDMVYCYGKGLKILYSSDPFTSEDACVFSESASKLLDSIEVNKVSVGINMNDFLLSIDKGDEYNPFPDVNDPVNGILAVKRTLNKEQLLTDFKDSSLRRINDSDTIYYSNGVVVDLDIYCNNDELENNKFNEKFIKYIESQDKYYEEIVEICEEIFETGAKFTKNLDFIYGIAKDFINKKSKWKNDDNIFGNILMEFTIKKKVGVNKGQKITGRYGNKSVVSKIVPDNEMPYYYNSNGEKVHVDVKLSLLAIINRTAASTVFEVSINFILDNIRDKLKFGNYNMKEKEKEIFEIMKMFNKEQYEKMYSVYKNLNKKEKEEYIDSCINKKIFIRQNPIQEDYPLFYKLIEIYEKHNWIKPYKMYVEKWGREIPCIRDGYISEMYMMKLKQTGKKGFSARHTGTINSKGLPERSHKNKSFTELHSSTAIRFGEFESLNFLIGVEPRALQLMHMLYRVSEEGRMDLSKVSFDDREGYETKKKYSSITAEILSVILKYLSLEIEFIDDEDELLREYDDKKLAVREYNGKLYLCTEFDFVLIKRKNDVEKEILKERGMIDKDELERLVMERLKERDYLIGIDKSEYDEHIAFSKDTAE